MLNLHALVKTGVNVVTDNAPAILTAFGVVGTVSTAVLAGKASFEAAEAIRLELQPDEDGKGRSALTKSETFKLVGPLYIPAATTGLLTCGAIVMSHRVSSKRAAALLAAYTISEGRLEEYQDKVKEKFGIKKEKEARDEINQERVTAIADAGFAFANPMTGKVWIMDAYTGRPFLGTVEEVRNAVNEINHHINKEGSARLSDFYDLIGLEHVSTSDYFGWTQDERLEVDWSTTTSPDGNIAVHVFEFVNHPVMNPEREAHPFR